MNELIELTDLQAVAKAQADRWEIEFFRYQDGSANGEWAEWKGKVWHEVWRFRGRPRQPKMKKVRMKCWLYENELHWIREPRQPFGTAIHLAEQDIEIEIPESV